MDEELQNLEAELTKLRPAAPSRELLARLGRTLAPRRAPVLGWTWLALPAAAAIAGVMVFIMRPQKAAAEFKPVAAQDVLYAARDEGYVPLVDGTPAHRLRESYVDTITWENPQTHASLRWSVPRDEIRVIPASFQ